VHRILGPVTLALLVALCPGAFARQDEQPGAGQVAVRIDRHLAQRHARAKITPSPRCDDAEFLRRAFLDVTGRIPSTARAAAFLDSTDPDRRAKLIDELLASKEYGRHFGRIWRDRIVRPDANMIRPPDTTPLVDWLAGRFNAGAGWDRIVHDMLTVEGNKPEGLFFNLNGDSRANPQSNVVAGTVGQLFMGVQLACAECHDHPFVDTWKQKDFWGVAAFFGRVRAIGNAKGAFGGSNITEFARGKLDRRNMAPKMVGTAIVVPDSSFKQIGQRIPARLPHGPEPKLDGARAFRPAFADWLVAKDNPYFARNAVNRLWAHFLGRGFVNPPGETSENNPPSHPELLDALAKDFAASEFDQKRLIRAIMLSSAYQRTSRPAPGNRSAEDHLFARQEIKVLPPEVLYDSLCQALEVEDLASKIGPRAAGKNRKKPAAAKRFAGFNPKQQFINFYTTKEVEADPTEYAHGIPQALRLMNQELFNTGGRSVERLVRARATPEKTIEGLYLVALSRRPTADEAAEMLAHVKKQPSPAAGYRAVFWVLINSAEFTINR
jgi:hypothetical protein